MLYIVKKTLNKIVTMGNHYLVKVKGNQGKLKTAIEQTVINSECIDYHREDVITRGRYEIRETYLYARENNMAKGWDSVQTIAFVRRDFVSKSRQHITVSFYITDLQTNNAKYIADGIRSHWHIENKLHYTKDVIMQEDTRSTKNKNAAANLALFRDITFNILKSKSNSIKYATEIFANYKTDKIMKILYRT